jgi:mitogen-activated protein kinase 1/3
MKENIFTTKLLDMKLASKTGKLANSNGIFIVMDYFPYDIRALLEKVDQDHFTREHIIIILYNLLCATHFMHSAGLMHRDIKPCNLLVDNECSVRICDFGQSRPYFERKES